MPIQILYAAEGAAFALASSPYIWPLWVPMLGPDLEHGTESY